MLGIEGRRFEMTEDGLPGPIRVHDNLFAVSIASMLPNEDEPVIWRGPLKMGAIRQFLEEISWPDLDYLIADCPPGTGDEPLSIVQLMGKVDGSVIVSTPQDVAFLDARKTINFSHKLTMPVLGIIENMASFVCPHCGKRSVSSKAKASRKRRWISASISWVVSRSIPISPSPAIPVAPTSTTSVR